LSAPDTNNRTQTRRHRPVLFGIAAAMVAAILVILISSGFEDEPITEPSENDSVTSPGDPALAPADPDAPWLGDPDQTAPRADTEAETQAPATDN